MWSPFDFRPDAPGRPFFFRFSCRVAPGAVDGTDRGWSADVLGAPRKPHGEVPHVPERVGNAVDRPTQERGAGGRPTPVGGVLPTSGLSGPRPTARCAPSRGRRGGR